MVGVAPCMLRGSNPLGRAKDRKGLTLLVDQSETGSAEPFFLDLLKTQNNSVKRPLFLLALLQFSLNHVHNALQAGFVWKLPIDINYGYSFNACLLALFYISDNQFLYGWVLHCAGKAFHIKLEFLGNLQNLGIVQYFVVRK
jgi:hypothetical protein